MISPSKETLLKKTYIRGHGPTHALPDYPVGVPHHRVNLSVGSLKVWVVVQSPPLQGSGSPGLTVALAHLLGLEHRRKVSINILMLQVSYLQQNNTQYFLFFHCLKNQRC